MLSRPVPSARQPKTVLLTGFDPFGGDAVNPSWQAVRALDGARIGNHRVVAAELPTVFGRSLRRLDELMDEHQPVLVVATGQAGGRGAISLERVAINVNDARIPDNVGAQPVDTPVVDEGPAAYFSTLPIKAMLAALLDEGLRAEVSQTAGTFVCNHVFYGLMHRLAQPRWAAARGGFLHVPWLPEQGLPAMHVDEIVAGLKVAIRVAATVREDARLPAGALN